MKIYPRASNAIDIELENGDVIGIHEYNNTLSFSTMPDHIRVTAHNVKTMSNDIIGENYQVSLAVVPPKYKG